MFFLISGYIIFSMNIRYVSTALKIQNPIGLKCGPSLKPDELIKLSNILNPDNEDVPIELRVDGALKYELTVARVQPGSAVNVEMFWAPMDSGTPTIEMLIDPANTLSNEDNVYGNIVSSTYTI